MKYYYKSQTNQDKVLDYSCYNISTFVTSNSKIILL